MLAQPEPHSMRAGENTTFQRTIMLNQRWWPGLSAEQTHKYHISKLRILLRKQAMGLEVR